MRINFPDLRIARDFVLDSAKVGYILNYLVPEQSRVGCEKY